MGTQSLLFKKQIEINDFIHIQIPTVEQVLQDEDMYYSQVTMLTAMPIDMMVQLADMDVDFTAINEYELFCYFTFIALRDQDTSLIFGDLDLSKFRIAESESDNSVVLLDTENDRKIDRNLYEKIAGTLRQIHKLEKNVKKPGNEEAKEYMIERARKKLNRRKKMNTPSHLETTIVSLVNTEQCKYDYQSIQKLSIYQFNETLVQIIHKVEYDNRMFGVYSGTVNVKELPPDELSWLKHK